MAGKISLYRNYRYITKDPLIDAMRVLIKEVRDAKEAHELTGVSPATWNGYFYGGTRNPRNATSTQLSGGLGFIRHDVMNRDGTVTPRLVKARDINKERELERQADFMLRRARADKRREKSGK